MKAENKVPKLYSNGETWRSVNLDHPSTFDTLAMDPTLKKELMDDSDRFVKRRDFYRTIGKAWKRGYLLYGPPSTGKSSLITAMANHLKFHIYDLELTRVQSNSEFRNLLVSTANQSILVIENIDCSKKFHNRKHEEYNNGGKQVSS
ncbi:Protein HYPER-SENSITIVITY-RELATED 4 [Camellia lanceoleosa]|uniref:Protein HYPER-SENSITIVITY-RELATED 4 n=1 Tax=Camellia lanceoleosa TaxID=1840588 RepID=A0ACC0I8D8_9ERIC|nr:Protein HYPER-SENSITIVITY-RELATED 4 [Camellia lanceoleosa]